MIDSRFVETLDKMQVETQRSCSNAKAAACERVLLARLVRKKKGGIVCDDVLASFDGPSITGSQCSKVVQDSQQSRVQLEAIDQISTGDRNIKPNMGSSSSKDVSRQDEVGKDGIEDAAITGNDFEIPTEVNSLRLVKSLSEKLNEITSTELLEHEDMKDKEIIFKSAILTTSTEENKQFEQEIQQEEPDISVSDVGQNSTAAADLSEVPVKNSDASTGCDVIQEVGTSTGRRSAMTMESVVLQACVAARLTRAVRAHRARKNQEKKQERKAARTLSAILLAFIVTWTPYNVFILVQAFCPGCIHPTLYDIGNYTKFVLKCLIIYYTGAVLCRGTVIWRGIRRCDEVRGTTQ